MDIEGKALITSEFKDISVNDKHIMEAIGEETPKICLMLKSFICYGGHLTNKYNGLVGHGYVARERSEEDRRVVLISLTGKGRKANEHHKKFHDGTRYSSFK